jgi:hypothetical protein
MLELIRQWRMWPFLMWVCVCVVSLLLMLWLGRGEGRGSNTCRWPSLKPVGSWPNTSQNPGVGLDRSYAVRCVCVLQQIDVLSRRSDLTVNIASVKQTSSFPVHAIYSRLKCPKVLWSSKYDIPPFIHLLYRHFVIIRQLLTIALLRFG